MNNNDLKETAERLKRYPANNPQAKLEKQPKGTPAGVECICSFCGFVITMKPIRLTIPNDKDHEFRFHSDCGKEATIRGLEQLL